MKIKKTNKTLDSFSIEKISNSLNPIFNNLRVKKEDLLKDLESITISKDDIDSFDIYELLINTALKKCVFNGDNFEDLDWRFVTARLKMKKLYKEISLNRKLSKLKPYNDFENFYQNIKFLVEKNIYSDLVLNYYSKEDLEKAYQIINPDYDYQYDFAGANILYKSYLSSIEKKIYELPQEAYLLIALTLATAYQKDKQPDFNKIAEIYEAIASLKISLATPILLNMRKKSGGYTSCIITSVADDTNSIFYALEQMAKLSSDGSGIGVNLSRIRAKGSWVRNEKGASNGVINYIKLINDIALTFDQGGKRAGSITVALDSWHLDIFEFLELQTENGDLRRKAFDVFPQMVVSDLFMQRVENDENWTLIDPFEIREKYNVELAELYGKEFEEIYQKIEQDKSILLKKTVSAKSIFVKFLKVVIETGLPYLTYKDTVNEVNPNKHAGMIGNLNLCVAGNTKILTKTGYKEIISLVDQEVELWNGEEWSLSKVFKTGENQQLLRVEFSDGNYVDCTEYHKFPIAENKYGSKKHIVKQARDLVIGDKLIRFNLPVIEGNKELTRAYENGFFTGDGSVQKNGLKQISLYGEKIKLIERFNYRLKGNYEEKSDRKRIILHEGLENKFFVPNSDYTIKSRLEWFAGLCDSDGCVARNGSNQSLQICSINKSFLIKVQYMLQTMGIYSKVLLASEAKDRMMPDGKGGSKLYYCKKAHRIIISSNDVYNLIQLGFETFRLKLNGLKPQRVAMRFNKIVNVSKLEKFEDTYCFTEPKRNMGMFNGNLLFQCVESFSNFKPTKVNRKKSFSNGETVYQEVIEKGYAHTCNLVSLNLSLLLTLDDISKYTEIATDIENRIIDLCNLPVEEAQRHNEDYRVIGIGIMGLHDHLVYNKMVYTKSREYVENLMEVIQFSSLSKSNQMAIEQNKKYKFFHGSEYSKGIICGKDKQWFENNNTYYGKDKWLELINRIQKTGLLNGSLNNIPPNTRTSLVCGTTSSFLPTFSKFFLDKNGNASVPIVPKYLDRDTFWYYQENKNMNQNDVINIASGLQKWIDQGISMELFIDSGKMTAKDVYDLYMNSWKSKTKAVYYVRQIKKKKNDKECVSCAN